MEVFIVGGNENYLIFMGSSLVFYKELNIELLFKLMFIR